MAVFFFFADLFFVFGFVGASGGGGFGIGFGGDHEDGDADADQEDCDEEDGDEGAAFLLLLVEDEGVFAGVGVGCTVDGDDLEVAVGHANEGHGLGATAHVGGEVFDGGDGFAGLGIEADFGVAGEGGEVGAGPGELNFGSRRDLARKLIEEFVGVSGAFAGVFGEALVDELDDGRGDVVVFGEDGVEGFGGFVDVFVEEGGVVVGGEGAFAGEHVIEQDAEGVDIDALVDVAHADDLFGGEEGGGADEALFAGDVGLAAGELGKSEVEDFNKVLMAVALAKHDVCGFDIAV